MGIIISLPWLELKLKRFTHLASYAGFPPEANSNPRLESKWFIWKMSLRDLVPGVKERDREVKEGSSDCIDGQATSGERGRDPPGNHWEPVGTNVNYTFELSYSRERTLRQL